MSFKPGTLKAMMLRLYGMLRGRRSEQPYESSLDRLDGPAQADAIAYRQRSGM